MRISQSRNAKGTDKVVCPQCEKQHMIQSKDLDAHLRSLETKSGRKSTRQPSQPNSAPTNRGTRIETEQERRVRNMRAAWSHVPADQMPEHIRQTLGY